MGTDIHLQVQGRRPDGTWEFVKRKPFPRYDEPGYDRDTDPTGRHYDLFALLADVRNGSGFAGVYRHEPVDALFADRGLPEEYADPAQAYDENINEAFRKVFTGGDPWLGDHSFTWATLTELLAVPWDTEFSSGGVVGPGGFKEWQETGRPSSWSGGISGGGIETHRDPEKYARMLDNGEIRYREGTEKGFYGGALDFCFVTWKWRPLEENTFRTWIEGPVMASLAEEYGGTDNIRIIMGFDS